VSTAAQIRHTFTSSWLNVLLIAAPVSWWLAWSHVSPRWLFVVAALSLVPAAGLIGAATDQLAERAGPTLGGFLNATFGNAAELIIAITALRAHHTAIVKASITGSIIGNLLSSSDSLRRGRLRARIAEVQSHVGRNGDGHAVSRRRRS
jgi:Ca2+:H+ antiporter